MDRREQIKWLKIRNKGFFCHFVTHGLAFCVPLIFGSAFVNNDFYLNISPIASYHLYSASIVGALLFSGSDWFFKSRKYKNTVEKYCEKMLINHFKWH